MNNYSPQSNSTTTIKINIGGFHMMIGNFEKSSKRGRGRRNRTASTYNKKLNRLKKRYTRFSKNVKFKIKYPTFESFLKKIPLKPVARREEKTYRPTVVSKSQRKTSMWGM